MGEFKVVNLVDVKRQPISWLWPGHIPRRKMTIVTGDPNLGKSWVVIDLMARVSAGLPWPDGTPGGPSGNVILLSAEDDTVDTIAPRFDLLGADASRVCILEPQDGVNLHDDLDKFGSLVLAKQAVFVCVDPLTAFLGEVDSFKDAEVRAFTGRLKSVIEDTNVAFIGLMHHNKDDKRRAVYRVLGSIAFTAAPRAHYMVQQDPNDPERRLFMCQKLSIAPQPPALAYRLTAAGPVWENRPVQDIDTDYVLSASGTQESPTERTDVEGFLREMLQGGPVPRKTVIAHARADGIRDWSLRLARERLDVQRMHNGKSGSAGVWFWLLPTPNHLTTPPRSSNALEVPNIADENGYPPIVREVVRPSQPLTTPHNPSNVNGDGHLRGIEEGVGVGRRGRHIDWDVINEEN